MAYDHYLITHPIAPPARAADRALRQAIATYLARHRAEGVRYECVPLGIWLRHRGVEHTLELRAGFNALDDALRQLTEWGVLQQRSAPRRVTWG